MKHIRSLILVLVLFAGFAPAFAQAPPPVPALPDAERRTSYVISASTCSCAVGFQLYQDSTDYAQWLTVYINGVQVLQPGNWTITSPSGSIATLPRPITNAVLTFTAPQTGTVQIVGAQRPRRLSEYAENRGVAARDLNQAINGIEAQLREMWDRQFRVVQAPPGETLALLPPLASRANMGACFNSSGNLAPCVAASGSFVAGTGIGFTGTNPTTISNTAATYSAGDGIVFTGTNPTVVSTSPSTSIPVAPSRATAITLNLSAYTAIQTAGYATASDGGGASFVKVGSTPFQDSYVTAGSITNAGSGCTNGTYLAVNLTGGTGVGLAANITVAGNVVTAVTIVKGGGNGYTVADTVTNSGVGCANWVWTVSAVSTPQASFTDSAANRWQYVPSPLISVRQFGAKGDWNGVDATATNDFTAIDAAIKFANRITSGARIDQGGKGGNFVYLADRPSLVCGALVVHGSVKLVGFGPFNSSLKVCDSGLSAAAHFITLGDPNIQSSCFGPGIKDVTLYANTTPPANNQTAMIFSNCAQQTTIIERVAVYSGLRSCFRYTNGYGGAAKITALDFFCTIFTGTFNDGISLDPTTTINMEFISLIVEAGGAGVTGNAVNWSSGNLFIWGYHTEGITTGLNVNVPVATYQSSIHGATGGNGCTELIKLAVTNTLNNTLVGTSQNNGCTRLITNGQPAGVNFAGPAVKDILCPGGACN